jgi:hypothetical protein
MKASDVKRYDIECKNCGITTLEKVEEKYGDYTLSADFEAAIKEAVEKERERIIGMFSDIRMSTLPTAYLTELEHRLRGALKPKTNCNCPECRPAEVVFVSAVKPGKIEKMDARDLDQLSWTSFFDKINEIIERVNER